jgi:hypothetical protein
MINPMCKTVRKSYQIIGVASVLLPFAVFASIWLPLVAHYHVPRIEISDAAAEWLRSHPGDSVFDEISTHGLIFQVRDNRNDEKKIRVANRILQGELSVTGYPVIDITLPFSEKDLTKGGETFQLLMASLIIPANLLDAYEITGEHRFFSAARNYILAWARYERSVWLPTGYLWNDHAIAERIFVLSRFWKLYRQHDEGFSYEEASKLLHAVARSAYLLADNDHFTFHTNHGVMQNLALLHVCIAFPALPDVGRYKKVAYERLIQQLGFYIGMEGFVLEHSAGYHELGTGLLGIALRYLSLLDIEIPVQLAETYAKAKKLLAELKRPDGTLPMYGDTTIQGATHIYVTDVDEHRYAQPLERKTQWRPPAATLLAPVAGYAVWWEGLDRWPNLEELSQTVTVWSYFPGHGHKNADEMSVLIWAAGQTWFTNVGYWPYGRKQRHRAVSWEGSNAPHWEHEPSRSERETQLLSYYDSKYIRYLDLERRNKDGYEARRQIVHVGTNLWLVLDHVHDAQKRNSLEVWTTYPDVVVEQVGSQNLYTLRGKARGQVSLSVAFLGGSEGHGIEQVAGSIEPFGGWVATGTHVMKSTSFLVGIPPNSWSAAVFQLVGPQGGGPLLLQPDMTLWQGPENWRMVIPSGEGAIEIFRDGHNLGILQSVNGSTSSVVTLEEGTDITAERVAIQEKFESAAERYEKFKPFYRYRIRISYVLVILFIFQELGIAFYKKFISPRVTILRTTASFCWLGLGVWLSLVYFSN